MITCNETTVTYSIDFCELETYEDFDLIIYTLKTFFDTDILNSIDGPESRVWEIEIEGVKVLVLNNPYGNSIRAESTAAILFLKSRYKKIKDIFKNVK